jgi:hypothetical protein
MIIIVYNVHQYFNDKDIEANGVLLKAGIESSAYNRSSYVIQFLFLYEGRLCQNSSDTNKFACQVGDSILIKVLPENPKGSVLIVDRIYKVKNRPKFPVRFFGWQ